MTKLKSIVLALTVIFLNQLISTPSFAAPISCESSAGLSITNISPNPVYQKQNGNLVSTTVSDTRSFLVSNKNYYLSFDSVAITRSPSNILPGATTLNFSYDSPTVVLETTLTIDLYESKSGLDSNICQFGKTLTLSPGDNTLGCDMTFTQVGKTNIACYDETSPIQVNISNLVLDGNIFNGAIKVYLDLGHPESAVATNGVATVTYDKIDAKATDYTIKVESAIVGKFIKTICTAPLKVKLKCADSERTPVDPKFNIPFFDQCAGISDTECTTCRGNGGVWTGLGCIHFSPKEFITDFLNIALGVAGGIALLLMIYGSFMVATSAGDPKKAEEGKGIITGTIAGLLFIIFSVFLLKLIGVNILDIPGFKP